MNFTSFIQYCTAVQSNEHSITCKYPIYLYIINIYITEAKYFKKRYPIKQNILNCCNPEAVVSDAKYIIYCKLSLTANQLILIIERCICMIFEYEISAIICLVQLL